MEMEEEKEGPNSDWRALHFIAALSFVSKSYATKSIMQPLLRMSHQDTWQLPIMLMQEWLSLVVYIFSVLWGTQQQSLEGGGKPSEAEEKGVPPSRYGGHLRQSLECFWVRVMEHMVEMLAVCLLPVQSCRIRCFWMLRPSPCLRQAG